MPHSTVRVNGPRVGYDFWNWKIDVVSVAYAYCDATETRKSPMNLPDATRLVIHYSYRHYSHIDTNTKTIKRFIYQIQLKIWKVKLSKLVWLLV